MIALAHRANLRGPDRERENSLPALSAALQAGFGIETDVRDALGQLVIAHDVPPATAVQFQDLVTAYTAAKIRLPLALNLKADGLRSRLKSALHEAGAVNYFCFDMSVPETLACSRDGLRFFTRESEYEQTPILYGEAAGIWLDMFQSDWATPDHIRKHLFRGKSVAIVSPELHGRPHLVFWEMLRTAGLGRATELMLCTDHPIAARDFFHD
jgi:glycerophosphoryl diester phosphodiesterase